MNIAKDYLKTLKTKDAPVKDKGVNFRTNQDVFDKAKRR